MQHIQDNSKMSRIELQSSLSLTSILCFRLFGLFLILPVFSLHASDLQDATPMLVGLAFGVYGLTQACLQIPFGMCSDKFGRKSMILIGLLIFAIGSLLAGIADSIWMMICGRAMQGAGAISAVLISLLTDLTREQQRTKAMALVGIGIGLAFSLAFTIGPILDSMIGMSGIFLLTAVTTIVPIFILYLLVPNPERLYTNNTMSLHVLKTIIKQQKLRQLNIGVFILHAVLMANFIVVPIALRDYAGLATAEHWQIYLPVIIASIVLITPIIMREARRNTSMHYISIAISLLLISQISYFLFHETLIVLAIALLIFFVAFNYLEASIPALISIVAPQNNKGAAMGVHASYQCLGIFSGGLIGGSVYQYYGFAAVFIVASLITMIWLLITLLPIVVAHNKE